jgi:hypothetical protein
MYLYRQSGRLTWQIRWWAKGLKRQVSTGSPDRNDAERILLTMREATQGRADERRIETLLRAAFAG